MISDVHLYIYIYINAVYSDDWDDPMMVMMVVMLTVMNVGHDKELLHRGAFLHREKWCLPKIGPKIQFRYPLVI